ncbi:hypothetical protein Tco_1451720, partial [Tanacetum coccineum]
IIIISSDNSSDSNSSSDLQSTDGPSSFDTSTSEEIVYSSSDIVSNKGPSKSLPKWYEDLKDEYIEEFWFSKAGGKKLKLNLLSQRLKHLGHLLQRLKHLTFGVKIPTAMTGAEEKKEKRKIRGGS